MTETRVGFLHKIVSNLPESENNDSLKVLRSFYLMRCKEITSAYSLPMKHFSKEARCPHCCLEWIKKSDVKIKPVKLSTRQKQRIKSIKVTESNEEKVNRRKAHVRSNQMEQTCSFCKLTTVTKLPKPVKEFTKNNNNINSITKTATIEQKEKKHSKETKSVPEKNKSKSNKKKIIESTKKNTSNTNVYTNAFDVFSLKNKQNTLTSTIKELPKIINNNKKKKDKFAGLCQKAVLASAKIKLDKGQDKKQNKLSLFLKPSSG